MSTSRTAKPTKKAADALIGYLQHHMPAYPYDPKLDLDFVEELVADFAGEIDVLEELKSFRWFYDNQPVTHLRSVRLSLRRWIANARKRRRQN